MAIEPLTNDELVNMANRASGMAIDLMLFATKMRQREIEPVVLPSATIRAIANLAGAASTFVIDLVDVLDAQAKMKN